MDLESLSGLQRRAIGTASAAFLMIDDDQLLLSDIFLHSHDLDHIDSIKRNSGVRSLALDPFFNSWEPSSIMAYLRDPAHYINGVDMLNEAGGKYLVRREIMNIFSQHLRKTYPGLDITQVKKEQEKYKQVKMCNFKGCNQAFADGKARAAHRKNAHHEQKHDHSHRIYTCPYKQCHRKKKSKGFPTIAGLRTHQVKMQHFGAGIYHSEKGPVECPPVTENIVMEDPNTESGDNRAGNGDASQISVAPPPAATSQLPLPQIGVSLAANAQYSTQHPPLATVSSDTHLLSQLMQQSTQDNDNDNNNNDDDDIIHIDPDMQPHPHGNTGVEPQPATDRGGMHSGMQIDSTMIMATEADADPERKRMMERYHALQSEMSELQSKLFGGA